jgi:hypothetical protein
LLVTEILARLVLYGIIVFDLLVLDRFESIQVKHEHRRVGFHVEFLEGKSHRITLFTVVRILFIKLLRLCEELEAIVDRGLTGVALLLIFILNVEVFTKVDLKLDFVVLLGEEVIKALVEYLR